MGSWEDLANDGATCPFVFCRAVVETVEEQAAPGVTSGWSVTRIKQHNIVGAFDWWGPCPASLSTIPATSSMHEAWSKVRESIMAAQARRERELPVVDVPTRPRPAAPTGNRPNPDPEPPYWFRNSEAPKRPTAGYVAGEPMKPVLLPERAAASEQKAGGGVASVAEVRAALAHANELTAQAQAMANEVGAKLAEALVAKQVASEASVDPMGIPQLGQAVELTMQIAALCHSSIEDTTTYMGGM